MDIASVATAMKAGNLSQAVALSVTRLAMDSSTTQSQAMVKMMEHSVDPRLGSTIDMRL